MNFYELPDGNRTLSWCRLLIGQKARRYTISFMPSDFRAWHLLNMKQMRVGNNSWRAKPYDESIGHAGNLSSTSTCNR